MSGAREAFGCAWWCGRIFLRFFGKAYNGRVKGRENAGNIGFVLVLNEGIEEAKPISNRQKCLCDPEWILSDKSGISRVLVEERFELCELRRG